MIVQEKLLTLRDRMKEEAIDVYLVFCTDYHLGEFINPYFKELEFISGFTGYVGTFIITMDKSYLVTDSRYTTQAKAELKDTEIEVSILDHADDLMSRLDAVMTEGQTLGFDGRYVSAIQGLEFERVVAEKKGQISSCSNLIDRIWKNRLEMPREEIYYLEEKYTGESAEAKLARFRIELKQRNVTCNFLVETDAICWLLNIRGNDIPYMCQPLCYALINQEVVHLYLNEYSMSKETKERLAKSNVILHPYESVYEVALDAKDHVILMDQSRVNYILYKKLIMHATIVHGVSPAMFMKASKNKIEIHNMRNAALKDSIAVTKFIYWVKKNVGKMSMNEYDLGLKIEEFRREQPLFIGPSFETGCAYGENAAMVFYNATEDNKRQIEEKGFLLVDSGGNYLDGSTDITRTIVVGDVTNQMKLHYTTVLACAFTLSEAKFPYGIKGCHLDVLARSNMWNLGLDYSTRSGHGVGYLLNVHEEPVDFKWKRNSEESPVLEEHMVLTIEPGVYLEGEYGIRLENDVIVRKDQETAAGLFMRFEKLTYVPFDLEAIDCDLLTKKQLNDLNAYHQQVWERISPYLEKDEQDWLKENTKKL